MPAPKPVLRRTTTTIVATMLAGAALLLPVSIGPVPAAGAAATDHTYHCTSLAGSSDSTYTIDATAPAQVEQGTEFAVDPVVVTGTPTVDLLLADIAFGILPPSGATLTSPAILHFDGPGSTDPPGPIAPAGVPNSSPPMSFSMVASGPVGSVITLYPAPVTSTVVDPADLSHRLDVSCSEITATAIATIEIVAPTTPTTDPTPPPTAAVLADTAGGRPGGQHHPGRDRLTPPETTIPPELGWIRGLDRGGSVGGGGRGAGAAAPEAHDQRLDLAVALERDRHLVAGLVLADRVDHVLGAAHRSTVDRGDHVAEA